MLSDPDVNNKKQSVIMQKQYKYYDGGNNYERSDTSTVKLGNKELFGHPKIVP